MRKDLLITLLINIMLASEDLDLWGSNIQVDLITDMSTTCVDDLHTDIYLPFGMGVADASVIIVSDNDLYPNCIISFHTIGGQAHERVYMVLVVEFPDHTEGLRNACQEESSTIKIEEPNTGAIDVCNEVNRLTFGYYTTAFYTMLTNASNVSVIITSKSLFETVKVTVTSARKLKQYGRCDTTKEIQCQIANASVCISKELQCDGNINCGSPTTNDEDVRICDEARYKRLWLVVVSGTIMVMILVLFLIHLLRTCLPSVPDSFFIFNEDEDNKLILSPKYLAPPEYLRQTLTKQIPPVQSSSFKFKSIPITHLSPPRALLATPSKTEDTKVTTEDDEELASLPSSGTEVELESHLYKQDIKRDIEKIVEDLPIQDKEMQEDKVNTARQTGLKKPRFQEADFVNIMDRIDLPTHVESSAAQQQTRKKVDHLEGQSKQKKVNIHKEHIRSFMETEKSSPTHREKKDRTTTFSSQEKHRRSMN